jgi:hypothetical protein
VQFVLVVNAPVSALHIQHVDLSYEVPLADLGIFAYLVKSVKKMDGLQLCCVGVCHMFCPPRWVKSLLFEARG